MIENVVAWIDWTNVFLWGVVFGIVLVAFQMQTVAKYEDVAGTAEKHGFWDIARRFLMMAKALSLAWCAIYAYDRGWGAWPPMATFVVMFDLHVLVTIIIMRANTIKILSGHRHVTIN